MVLTPFLLRPLRYTYVVAPQYHLRINDGNHVFLRFVWRKRGTNGIAYCMVALVLAAGLGRRFDKGIRQEDALHTADERENKQSQQAAEADKPRRQLGGKQLAAVDSRGQTLLEYALFDAHQMGVDEVVLVTHPQGQVILHERVGKRLERCLRVRYAVQSPPSVYGFDANHPPLGTGHAFLCGAQDIRHPFIVMNADDFYGRDAIRQAVACAEAGQYGCVAYPAGQTVENAAVHRGICLGENGRLTGICECTFARDSAGNLYAEDGTCRRYMPEQTPVNMNLYAMQPAIRASAARFFAEHLQSGRDEECFLGDMVTDFLGRTHRIMYILPSVSRWYGMTYRHDLEIIRRVIQTKVDMGEYPENLWA